MKPSNTICLAALLLSTAWTAPGCASQTCSASAPAAKPGVGEASAAGGSVVSIEQRGDDFVLLRNGEPYALRGIGGTSRLELAKQLGANSLRTWGSDQWEETFEHAERVDFTVWAGFWLSHEAKDYESEEYQERARRDVRENVAKYKDHPAVLMWCLGNEIQLGADNPTAWKFVEELAQIIQELDPHHPIATVTAHSPPQTLDHIVEFAPSIQVLGVNSYGGLPVVPRDIDKSQFRGPWVVTEWGPNGHWEVGKTRWGRTIEPLGAEKVTTYQKRAEFLAAQKGRCLGDYIFLWGQKQEQTPTWYSMFVEELPDLGLNGEATGAVDVAQWAWTGSWPDNRAPAVTAFTLNGQRASSSVQLAAGEAAHAEVVAEDPEGATLSYVWEVLVEPGSYGSGGSFEARPPRAEGALQADGATATVTVAKPGEYRVFVYALDGAGKVSTANVPFKVE